MVAITRRYALALTGALATPPALSRSATILRHASHLRGTPAGIVAGCAAAREGASVALLL
jgi:hypothetical protein